MVEVTINRERERGSPFNRESRPRLLDDQDTETDKRMQGSSNYFPDDTIKFHGERERRITGKRERQNRV